MTRDALCASTATKSDAPIRADLNTAAHQHDADLAGPLNVRPAARLQIGGLDFNGAQYALAVDFFSHAELRQLVRGSVAHVDRTILEYALIRSALGAFEYCFRWLGAAQVNRGEFGAKMEGNRGQSEAFLKHG